MRLEVTDEKWQQAFDALADAEDYAVLTRSEKRGVEVVMVGEVEQIGALLRGIQRVVDDQLLGVVDEEDEDED